MLFLFRLLLLSNFCSKAIFPDDDTLNLYLKSDRLGLNPYDYFHFRSRHITYLMDDERSLLTGVSELSDLPEFNISLYCLAFVY